MKTQNLRYLTVPALMTMAAATLGTTALSQPTNPPASARSFGGPQIPQVISPQVLPDRQIAFRVFAPKAKDVRRAGGDLPDLGQGAAMNQVTNGVLEITVGPIDEGAYRYNFNVDGLSVIETSRTTVATLKKHGFNVIYEESAGGHTWPNWRNYLHQFAPQLFQF